ncbi:hypothetical protein Rxycam_01171 [Rubrobacter xylanophilus DSM 9941]|nr:hypothetical protein Rxycam_01171 [Rubrobacter xylanophilus DSM 9941]
MLSSRPQGDGRTARESNAVRRDAAGVEESAVRAECEVCGARMFGLHCKLVCPRCGFRRDCSDP